MKTLRRIYLGTALMMTIGIYALVFGDVGYLKRSMMEKEAAKLQSKLSLLKLENRYLNEQYALLSQKPIHKLSAKELLRQPEVTILKFEEEKTQNSGLASLFSRRQNSLVEARILFLAIMLLACSCGYLFLYRLSKERAHPSASTL